MKKGITFSIIIMLVSSLTFLVGRSFRVNQVPNGSKFSCNTCHTNGGGSSRNPFGIEIGTNFLTAPGSNGNVNWGPDLAALDSDGDGFSNGVELQDPNGEWTTGMPNPGDPTKVTNPGDPNSFPQVTSVDNLAELPLKFDLKNNYPNPFNPTTNIKFSIAKNTNVKLDIFNSLGEHIRTLVDDFYSPGNYTAIWNARDDFGYKVNSGVYIYRIATNNFVSSKRMVLMK